MLQFRFSVEEVVVNRRYLAPWTFVLALAFALVPLSIPRLRGQAPARPAVIALKGATILTVTRGTIPNGTVLMRDGKIAAVGATVDDPRRRRHRRRHRQVRLARHHRRTFAHRQRRHQRGRHDGQLDDRHARRAGPDRHQHLPRPGRRVTTANVLHGSANPIGGKNQVIKLRWGKTRPQDLEFEGALPGIKFALGENPKDMRQGQITGPRRYPVTRMGVEYVIRDAFTRAKAYQKAWQDYEKKKGSSADAAAAAARPAARTAGRDPRGQAAGARAQLPRRRDPDADPPGRRDGLQDRDLPARARGLQGGEGDCRARRRRLDLLRLVGLQGRGGRRDPVQRRDHGPQGRADRRSTPTAPSWRAASTPKRRRPIRWGGLTRRGGARARHHQSREAAADRSAASARSKPARTPTSSSGTSTRSAPTPSRNASTSTARSTTTGSPKTRA